MAMAMMKSIGTYHRYPSSSSTGVVELWSCSPESLRESSFELMFVIAHFPLSLLRMGVGIQCWNIWSSSRRPRRYARSWSVSITGARLELRVRLSFVYMQEDTRLRLMQYTHGRSLLQRLFAFDMGRKPGGSFDDL